jgi:hypothetical protein
MFHLGTSKSSIYRRLYLYTAVSFFFRITGILSIPLPPRWVGDAAGPWAAQTRKRTWVYSLDRSTIRQLSSRVKYQYAGRHTIDRAFNGYVTLMRG